MPSDCWSAGVILYIMLACVTQKKSQYLQRSILVYSGCHPFDYERRASSKWVTCSTNNSIIHSQQPSVHRSQADARLKERIVRAEVDYFEDPWKQLTDGLLVSPRSMTQADNRFSTTIS